MPIMHPKVMAAKKKLYVQALRDGATHQLAADYAGISRVTSWRWRTMGEEGDEEHAEFFRQALEAESSADMESLKRIREHAHDDWRADAWILERRRPDQWGKRDHRTIEATHAHDLTGVFASRPADEIRAILGEDDDPG